MKKRYPRCTVVKRIGGIRYCLWVTDPVHERRYLAKPDGTYPVDECFLTISLGEPFGGAVYKLIASIITRWCRWLS